MHIPQCCTPSSLPLSLHTHTVLKGMRAHTRGPLVWWQEEEEEERGEKEIRFHRDNAPLSLPQDGQDGKTPETGSAE